MGEWYAQSPCEWSGWQGAGEVAEEAAAAEGEEQDGLPVDLCKAMRSNGVR